MKQPEVRAIASDADAFEAFYREHLEVVRRFVARRVDDPHTAADLTADIFLAAMDAAGTYSPDRGSPAGWLIGVARNVIAAEYRRQFRQRRVVRRLSGRPALDPDSLNRLIDRLDAERDSRRLYAALAELPERDRALLELVALDGLSVAEAAMVLGLNAGTARVRLHRARTRLISHWPPETAALIAEATS